ncbi:hypothetical protein [Rubricoccus marinus]|uniref:Uncharacterized protein n=1 Tax=Rubricoccus marinus TaxID=716817 RepID=A0A259U114_9BACT|nr:hypothetical protein [Rubricoccus marinus]OZC03689.1 hypothetical protein BSZ36_12270 [Rubricoccus marinus]
MPQLLLSRILPLLLIGVVAGCDSNPLRANDVRRGFVRTFELEDFPLVQPDGNEWDSGLTSPNPDIYLVLETRSGELIIETAPIPNVDSRDLPVFYDVPATEVGIDEEVYVVLYDDDGLLDDEFIDEIGPFRLGDYLESDLNESFRVTSGSGDTEVRLSVRWSD